MMYSSIPAARAMVGEPIACAGVVCLSADGREVLLIRRGQAPMQGQWSIPGGRIEAGERAADAALRELREETGVQARILGLAGVTDLLADSDEALEPANATRHYILITYAAIWTQGHIRPADDALEAIFCPVSQSLQLIAWEPTRAVIRTALTLFR